MLRPIKTIKSTLVLHTLRVTGKHRLEMLTHLRSLDFERYYIVSGCYFMSRTWVLGSNLNRFPPLSLSSFSPPTASTHSSPDGIS